MEKVDFKKSVKILFTDVKFLGLTFAFAVFNGNFNIYSSVLDDILDPYGYNPDQVSWLGVALMVMGIVIAVVLGAYVERTLNYKLMFRVCAFFGFVTAIGFPLCLRVMSEQFWIFMVIALMQGIVFIPIQPLTSDYACDTMFPIG